MNFYKGFEVWTVIMAFLACNLKIKGLPEFTLQDRSKKSSYILLTAVPLILLTGFRANMETDYLTYEYIYKFVIKEKSVSEILRDGQEFGFALLQKVTGSLSDYNTVALMTVLAAITVGCYYYVFYRYSATLWLSVLLLLVAGSYSTSFNTTRQFLACALFFAACIFVFKRRLLGYIIAVLCIASIHKSALLMLPCYWILNINWKSKKQILLSACVVFGGGVCLLYLKQIFIFVSGLLYRNYSEGGYGYGESYSGYAILIRPVFFLLFLVINRKAIDFNDRVERCCFNGTLYFAIVYILSYKIYILYRFTYYFLPFILLAIPNIICKENNRRNRVINLALVLSFLCVYFVFGQADLRYEFYWKQ